MEREAFGRGAFSEGYLEAEFMEPANVVALLGLAGDIVGFTIAGPIGRYDSSRQAESGETAYVSDTVMAARWRGRGMVATLMDTLETELRLRGYRFLERDAGMAFGYAAAIDRAYGSRIIHRAGPRQSEWGPQMFFRIALTQGEGNKNRPPTEAPGGISGERGRDPR